VWQVTVAIIESPELSFGSECYLAKPSLKSFQVFAHTKPSGAEQPALIIVFGLVPSLVVLALLLSVNPIPNGLQLAQAGIFAWVSLHSYSLE